MRTLCITLLLLMAGCQQFSDNRVVKPLDTSSYEFNRTLAMLVKYRYKVDLSIEELAKELMFERAYAEYKMKYNE